MPVNTVSSCAWVSLITWPGIAGYRVATELQGLKVKSLSSFVNGFSKMAIIGSAIV
jgi:hypothetical protein